MKSTRACLAQSLSDDVSVCWRAYCGSGRTTALINYSYIRIISMQKWLIHTWSMKQLYVDVSCYYRVVREKSALSIYTTIKSRLYFGQFQISSRSIVPIGVKKKKNFEFYIHTRGNMSSIITPLVFPARLQNREMEFSFCTFARRFSSLIRDSLSQRDQYSERLHDWN